MIGQRLRAALDSAGLSNAALGRALAERDGTKPESKRRLVQKYLKDQVAPQPPITEWLADILGTPADRFVSPPDPRERRDLAAAWALLEEIRETVGRLQERLAEKDDRRGPPRSAGGTP